MGEQELVEARSVELHFSSASAFVFVSCNHAIPCPSGVTSGIIELYRVSDVQGSNIGSPFQT